MAPGQLRLAHRPEHLDGRRQCAGHRRQFLRAARSGATPTGRPRASGSRRRTRRTRSWRPQAAPSRTWWATCGWVIRCRPGSRGPDHGSGSNGQPHIDQPQQLVAARRFHGPATQPDSHEASDLVDQHDHAEEHSEPGRAIPLRHQLRSGRQCCHVAGAHDGREAQHHERRDRQEQQRENPRCPHRVDPGQQPAAVESLERQPGGDAAGDIGGARDREPGPGQGCGEPAAFDNARHMNIEEGHMEAADREACRRCARNTLAAMRRLPRPLRPMCAAGPKAPPAGETALPMAARPGTRRPWPAMRLTSRGDRSPTG